jgi:dihydrofolate reductase
MISAIVAATPQGGIGFNGTLPWPKNSEDLKWFRHHTENHIVIMGRNTWEDPAMPKPLPNRINYLVSSTLPESRYRGLIKWIPGNPVENIPKIAQEYPDKTVFIIGGQQLFESCQPIIERVYLTRFKSNYRTDVRLHLDRWLSNFQCRSVKPGQDCTYEVWDLKKDNKS